MSRPEPRPALKRADDGAVHPAAPRVTAERHIHPAPHAPTAVGKEDKPRKGMKAAVDEPPPAVVFDGKPVTLSVEVPKPLRKQLRKVAERDGRSVDDVVVDALTRYLVG
jgi:hypothetical protein